jgi:hypothetical protein
LRKKSRKSLPGSRSAVSAAATTRKTGSSGRNTAGSARSRFAGRSATTNGGSVSARTRKSLGSKHSKGTSSAVLCQCAGCRLSRARDAIHSRINKNSAEAVAAALSGKHQCYLCGRWGDGFTQETVKVIGRGSHFTFWACSVTETDCWTLENRTWKALASKFR